MTLYFWHNINSNPVVPNTPYILKHTCKFNINFFWCIFNCFIFYFSFISFARWHISNPLFTCPASWKTKMKEPERCDTIRHIPGIFQVDACISLMLFSTVYQFYFDCSFCFSLHLFCLYLMLFNLRVVL